MWYDGSKILSYNKIINFVIGNRGGGKTFWAKKWAVTDFKKKGKTFVWIRRYKDELDNKKLSRFFDDIADLFPDDKLEVKNKVAYINDKKFGDFIPLSTAAQFKSVPFPTVNKVIFDEFIIDKGSIRYIKNEAEGFLELYSTIARLRDDVRAVFLGNSISISNPYFMYFKLTPKLNKRFTSNDDIIIEMFTDTDYIDQVNKTRFGRLVAGTSYGDYAVDNNFLRDSQTFIEKRTPASEFLCGMKYNGVMYGYWIDYKAGLIFMSQQHDPFSYALYTLTKDDHEPNLLLIKSMARNRHLAKIVFAFEHGLMRFNDQMTKNQFYDLIRYFVR